MIEGKNTATAESETVLEARLERAERRVRRVSLGVLLIAAGLVVGFVAPGSGDTSSGDVVTARGLVIVDEAGRPRVVVGAPASAALDDPRLAQTTGMIVLDAEDRLAVAAGADPPLIMVGDSLSRRIGSTNGFTFYDPRNGKERGGVGAFEDGRANMCIDYGNASKEAAYMTVAPDDQYAAGC